MTDKYGPNTFSEAMSIIRGLEARVAELEAIPEYVNTQNEIEIASLRAEVAAEREACAKVVDYYAKEDDRNQFGLAEDIAAAIRARKP